MNTLEFFYKIEDKYHDEVNDLIEIIEQDMINEEVEKEKEQAMERINELIKISNPKR